MQQMVKLLHKMTLKKKIKKERKNQKAKNIKA